MPYDFQDEATVRQMAQRWGVSYARLARIIRHMAEPAIRMERTAQYFDRASQHRIGTRLAFYQKHPRALAQAEKLMRVQEANDRMGKEIALMERIEQLTDQVEALSHPDRDEGLVLRLLPACRQLYGMDEAAYGQFQADMVDNNSTIVILCGLMKALGPALDGATRQHDARLLSTGHMLELYRALSNLAEVGKMADQRLDQYDAMTRHPQEA